MPPWSQGEVREGEAGSRRRPSEGGKRSCSPSEVSMWENKRADGSPTLTPFTEKKMLTVLRNFLTEVSPIDYAGDNSVVELQTR